MFRVEARSEEACVARADDIAGAILRCEPHEIVINKWNSLIMDMKIKNPEKLKAVLLYIFSHVIKKIEERDGSIPEDILEAKESVEEMDSKETPVRRFEEILNDLCSKVYKRIKRPLKKEEDRHGVF